MHGPRAVVHGCEQRALQRNPPPPLANSPCRVPGRILNGPVVTQLDLATGPNLTRGTARRGAKASCSSPLVMSRWLPERSPAGRPCGHSGIARQVSSAPLGNVARAGVEPRRPVSLKCPISEDGADE
jgi:hypothetical protein